MKYVKIILLLAIIVTLLYFFVQNVEFNQVISIIKDVNPILPLIFIIGSLLQFFIRSYRWGILLTPYKRKISILSLFNYTLVGFFINTIIPGRLGEPARGILLAQEEKINHSKCLATVVQERLIDILMMVLIFIISVFFIDTANVLFLAKLKSISLFLLPLIVGFFIMFYFLNTPVVFKIIERVIRFLARILPESKRKKVIGFVLDFIKALNLRLKLSDFIKLWIYSFIVWLFLIPFYWILMQGFDFGSGVDLLETIPYFAIILMAAAVPTPGMAGSFDAASRHGLQILFGAQTNSAAAYTILVHFLILITILVPGLFVVWRKGLSFKTIKTIKGVNYEVS